MVAMKPEMKAHVMFRTAVALRMRTIRDKHVTHHRTHQDRLKLAESVQQKNARVYQDLEYNHLLGASQFGRLTPYAIGRLDDLKNKLKNGWLHPWTPVNVCAQIWIY